MAYMFGKMTNLKQLDLTKWQTSNVESMQLMFSEANSLTRLDLSTWDTNQVIKTDEMFKKTSNLKKLDISSWNTSNIVSMTNMFENTPNLQQLTLGKMTLLKNRKLGNSPKNTIYTSKWQNIGNGSVNNPKGNWIGNANELEIKTQTTPTKDTYVWQPLLGTFNISKYPESYLFKKTVTQTTGEMSIAPRDSETKYVAVKDERRVTSPWELKVSANPLVFHNDTNTTIENARYEFKSNIVSFDAQGNPISPIGHTLPVFKSSINLSTDNSFVTIMTLGDNNNLEPKTGEYGLSLADMNLVIPVNNVQKKGEYKRSLNWSLDTVPEFGK